MKKLIFVFLILFASEFLSAKDKFFAAFEFNGNKYECKIEYQRSELIPTYKLNIRATDLRTKIVRVSDLIIKKQVYAHNLKNNVEIWERFLKRKSSYRTPREITFHIVDENKSYATFIFERSILTEYYFNDELCLVKNRDQKVFIYPNESVILAVVKQFLKGTECFPNETVVTKL